MKPKLTHDLLLRLLRMVLRPAVSFCVRHSLKLQDLMECAKVAFVEQSKAELERQGEKSNVSRVSVMSGVHRRDVMRIEENPAKAQYARDIVTKVIGAWTSDPRFHTKSKLPKVLTCQGDDCEFVELARSVSQDMNPGTIMFELERVGAVERTRAGVRLVAGSYIPKGDVEGGFSILARDGEDLLKAVEENVIFPKDLPQFHARTEYDNVRPEGVQALKEWFLREGHKLHASAREIIGKYDQDINPSPSFKGKGVKVVMGGFSYVEEPSSDE